MLHRVVEYLRAQGVSFRFSSYPSREAVPAVALRPPPGGVVLDAHVLRVAGQPAIACVARGARISLPRLSDALATDVIEATADDLPEPYRGAAGPVPPLGREIGAITLLDEAASRASVLVFAAFSANDLFEIPADAFARLERPRIVSFAIGGELPDRGAVDEPQIQKRSA
jgi:prolyl-tRNA editing enzyme YbaK/EbsC (Cys-tRNA(Pro) deacylase)